MCHVQSYALDYHPNFCNYRGIQILWEVGALIRLIIGKLRIKANKLTNTLRMAEYKYKDLTVPQLNYEISLKQCLLHALYYTHSYQEQSQPHPKPHVKLSYAFFF